MVSNTAFVKFSRGGVLLSSAGLQKSGDGSLVALSDGIKEPEKKPDELCAGAKWLDSGAWKCPDGSLVLPDEDAGEGDEEGEGGEEEEITDTGDPPKVG